MSIILYLLAQMSLAQSNFNVVQQHPSTLSYNGACSVFEKFDGYLVFSYGWALDSAAGAVQIAKYDLEGQFQWQIEHTRQRNIYPGLVDPIAGISGDRYVAAMDEYGGLEPIITYLYWFNSNGDTIRTRFMKSDSALVDANHGTRQLVSLSDGGFLHCGWCGVPQNTGCITRLDSAGAIVWEQVYPGTNYIHNATELPDGGFVLGGSRPLGQDRAVVIRTDSAGNQQWIQYHGLYSNTSATQAHLEDAGSLLIAGSWKSDPNTQTYDRWSSLYKYASNGDLLSRRDYVYGYNARAGFVLPKANGNYWLVGGMFQFIVEPDYVTTLWELDDNLDSLWMRRYYYYESDGAESGVACVRSTSDGGLVMCGSTRQGVTDPLPYLQSNWLIKLDSYGCLVPGCYTMGVQDIILGLNEHLRIAPNPVRGVLQAELVLPPGMLLQGSVRAVLLNAQGQQVQVWPITRSGDLLSLREDISSLSGGVYYLHIADEKRWLAGAKVLCSP